MNDRTGQCSSGFLCTQHTLVAGQSHDCWCHFRFHACSKHFATLCISCCPSRSCRTLHLNCCKWSVLPPSTPSVIVSCCTAVLRPFIRFTNPARIDSQVTRLQTSNTRTGTPAPCSLQLELPPRSLVCRPQARPLMSSVSRCQPWRTAEACCRTCSAPNWHECFMLICTHEVSAATCCKTFIYTDQYQHQHCSTWNSNSVKGQW